MITCNTFLDEALTKEKKDFIDEQIQHFIGLTQRTLSVKEHRRQKRSLPIDEIDGLSKDNYGMYYKEFKNRI